MKIIGEKINSTRKCVAQVITERDAAFIADLAQKQAEASAAWLDVNAEGHDETPLCSHRAPLSTHERMIGFLIEHYAGVFPVWLAPEQVRVIPITDGHVNYAWQVAAELRDAGIRGSTDLGSERMNPKIRNA